jgi:hypothetical protein
MPYYEYQGKTYEISTDDPAEARAKIQAYLGDNKMDTEAGKEFGAGELAQMAAPLGMPNQVITQPSGFAKYPPTGLGRLAADVAVPAGEYAKGAIAPIVQNYKKMPFVQGAVDLGSMALSLPPLMSTIQGVLGLQDRFNKGKEALGQVVENVGKTAGSSDLVPYEKSGNMMYQSQPTYNKVWTELNKVDPKLSQQLSEITKGPGAASAAAKFLQSPVIQGVMEGNAEFAKHADEFVKMVPTSRAQQALQLIKPFGRAAARVAGPVGLGMDIYDAASYAQEAELGNRLAQGQGRNAQQAFRNMNIKNASPISPEEAAAVLQNGSPRDIEAMGGQETLNALIRQKAASKVLAPVAPTGL